MSRPSPTLIGPTTPEQVHVMSINIRCDRSGDEGTRPGDADHWPERRPALIGLLTREQPAVLGVQEALYGQLSAIEEALPGHRRVGCGREGGSHGEHAAIFYDAERFEALSWDQFWLSDTPEMIGSTTWGHTVPRIVVRVQLRDLATRRELTVLNTHFDHESESARRRSARALTDLLAGGSLPAIVTGDFNAAAHGSGAYTTLVTDGPIVDTWDTAEARLTPAWGTFPDYGAPVEDGERIDWILTSEDITTVRAAINVSSGGEGRFPSDHAAVQALLALP
ncbi:hypothetical protein CFK38_02305 [Brachybacterium vulturis]|uniref:Endonuclease/exonuclease/phosphatase domain-containing protein n=1 Tax=Brachybacterium vulturis TaxID=2017484 RepID=A0A291GIX8_9MICO|nr:endonuclease/exonuclease/phosphatase family protein [Brachybacterium vulturis]ATG50483.1 hypothetical protein CFK38_02305 [Brachybacterium vulturis]